VAVGE